MRSRDESLNIIFRGAEVNKSEIILKSECLHPTPLTKLISNITLIICMICKQ